MNTKPTLTIGIPAYNEEHNIQRALQSVLAQNLVGFEIQKIIVASDGSTDKTVDAARAIHDSRIEVLADPENKGRIYRLNQIMRKSTSDFVIFIDADEALIDPEALEKLLKPFGEDPMVQLVGGNPQTNEDKSFLSVSHKTTRDAYTRMRYNINNGNNIFGCMGGMLALSRKFYQEMQIPSDIFADDCFMYLTCITKGFKFRNAKDATIAHYLPYSISGHIKRNKRHSKTRDDLKKYFGDLVDKEFAIPKEVYLEATLRQVIKDPIHTGFIYGVNSYIRLLSKYNI